MKKLLAATLLLASTAGTAWAQVPRSDNAGLILLQEMQKMSGNPYYQLRQQGVITEQDLSPPKKDPNLIRFIDKGVEGEILNETPLQTEPAAAP